MNRRVVYTRGGSLADVLTVVGEPEPAAPETGQVLVRTTAFPVQRPLSLAALTDNATIAGSRTAFIAQPVAVASFITAAIRKS